MVVVAVTLPLANPHKHWFFFSSDFIVGIGPPDFPLFLNRYQPETSRKTGPSQAKTLYHF